MKLREKIAEMEIIITEQKHFINATISKKFFDDEDLYLKNDGPGGAYDKYNTGAVV